MNAMHTRRNNKVDEPVFDSFWQSHVRVVKQDGKQQESLPAEQYFRVNTDQQNLRDSIRYGECDLSEVEPEGGRSIQIEINVVDGMKAPEQGRAVMQDMLEIQGVIKQQYRRDDFNESRQL